ncbi:MAG: transcription termination factor NusA [Christensenellales bacterium]
MNSELMEALYAIEKERGVDVDVLIEAIETALISAYKRNYGSAGNVRVEADMENGAFKVFASKTVVEEVANSASEISLEEARSINQAYEPGDVLETEITPRSFGRIAAQTAKQVVVQRIHEAERGVIFNEYIEKENEILTGIVQRAEKSGVYLELGRTEGLMLPQEMVGMETYTQNERIKVYVLEVKNSAKGPQILVSRTHPNLVKRLFEMEVPEIQSGVVRIESISREAGHRTKIAVSSSDEAVDPVGACVGQRGTRVDHIVQELRGEKIDIIKWSNDPVEYIANALSPSKVIFVHTNEETKSAKVIVPDNQLSLAIGKEGQNARLAAKLTGWRIDIKSQSQAEEMME